MIELAPARQRMIEAKKALDRAQSDYLIASEAYHGLVDKLWRESIKAAETREGPTTFR